MDEDLYPIEWDEPSHPENWSEDEELEDLLDIYL